MRGDSDGKSALVDEAALGGVGAVIGRHVLHHPGVGELRAGVARLHSQSCGGRPAALAGQLRQLLGLLKAEGGVARAAEAQDVLAAIACHEGQLRGQGAAVRQVDETAADGQQLGVGGWRHACAAVAAVPFFVAVAACGCFHVDGPDRSS